MKSKIKGVLGIGFALILVASMLVFAIPVSGGAYANLSPTLPNTWAGFQPTEGALGKWFFDHNITQVGPIAQAINGDLYCFVANAGDSGLTEATPNNTGYNDIFKSTDGGHTWTVSAVPSYLVHPIASGVESVATFIDIVCSQQSEDVLYATDGYYVYKSINGGQTFSIVAEDSLETLLVGTCGPSVSLYSTFSPNPPITCLDVGYNASGDSIVFVGVTGVAVSGTYNSSYPSVLYINEAGYPSQWVDLALHCFHAGGGGTPGLYLPLSIGVAPDFATSKKIYVCATVADDQSTGPADPSTYIISSVGVTCSWSAVDELFWNCNASNNFQICHASRFAFPADYATLGTMFIGVTAWNGSTTYTPGGDVYCAFDTVPQAQDALDLNVQGYTTGCIGLYHANINSLAINGNGELLAGAYDSYQLQSPTRVYYSADGGWTWTPSLKDPTGTDRTYVLWAGDAAVAGTRGCDCAFSMSCGTLTGQYWNQISLISMYIEEVLDMSHAPGYLDGSSTMYVLTTSDIGPSDVPPFAADAFKLTASAATTATVTETAGAVLVTVLTDPNSNVVISYNPYTKVWSITFGDNLDSVTVTALCDGTIATWAGTNVTAAETVDQDGDMTVASGAGAVTMPDGMEIRSLLKWDGTYWQRVHDTRFYYALGQAWVFTPLYDWVSVSPDFNDTGCLYMANTAFGMTRSVDEGCSWRPLAYPCAPLPTISAWIVVDEETVLAAGWPTSGAASGKIFVYKTDRHGTRPWTAVPVLGWTGTQASIRTPYNLGVDFDLSPNIGADQNVLLSDVDGHVYLNRDLAATAFNEVADISATGTPTPFGYAYLGAGEDNTYCVFDPAYDGTADAAGYIYAAGGSLVGRCNLNLAAPLAAQTWEYISVAGATSCDPFDMVEASGIAVQGDTVLYVSDAGGAGGFATNTVYGSLDFQYYDETGDLTSCDVTVDHTTTMTFTVTSGTFVDDEPLSILSYNLQCLEGAHVNVIEGDLIVKGLTSGAIGVVHISEHPHGYCPECDYGTGVILLSGVLRVHAPTSTSAGHTGVWRTLNPQGDLLPVPTIEWEFLPLVTAEVPTPVAHELRHPVADNFSPAVYPDDLWLTSASNMLWALDRAIYEQGDTPYIDTIWMFDDTLAAPVVLDSPADKALLATSTTVTLSWEALDTATLYEYMIFSYCPSCPDNMELFTDDTTDLTCIPITGLTPGTTYYWWVRVACNEPYVSKWSELRSFNTALSTVPYLCSPICGASDIILSPNFSWDAVTGATSYEVQVSTDDAFANIVASGTTSTNAWVSGVTLDYSTAYYWRVRAVSDGVYSAWATCLFTTMEQPAAPPTPTPPVEVIQKNVTPTWIWVIIGIGGALTIAVVILIVTTRRVP